MDLDRSPRRLNADWCRELTSAGPPYFTVSYYQPGVNLPQIETLIYLGSTQISEEVGEPRTGLLFQNAQSYQEHGDWSVLPDARRDEMAAEHEVMFFNEDTVSHVADIDGLLVLLSGLRERMLRGLDWEGFLPEQSR